MNTTKIESQTTELKNPNPTKTARKRKFSQYNKGHVGIKAFECPDCHGLFGLEIKFLDNMSEVNLYYFCPYCGKQAGIEN